jgi:hypothetical protein
MSQTQLGSTDSDTSSGNGEGDASTVDTDQTTEENTGEFDYVKYLLPHRLKFIHGLAGTLHTVEEADKYIEAEKKRRDRDDVLRILRNKRDEIATYPRFES